jgi:hypothetical protein
MPIQSPVFHSCGGNEQELRYMLLLRFSNRLQHQDKTFATMEGSVLCDVTRSGTVGDGYSRKAGLDHGSSTLKMEAIRSSGTPTYFNYPT